MINRKGLEEFVMEERKEEKKEVPTYRWPICGHFPDMVRIFEELEELNSSFQKKIQAPKGAE